MADTPVVRRRARRSNRPLSISGGAKRRCRMLPSDRFKVRLRARSGSHCAQLGDETVQERGL